MLLTTQYHPDRKRNARNHEQDDRSMTAFASTRCAAFSGHRLLAAGARLDVALAMKRALDADATGPVLAFDDATGAVIDFDLSGSDAQVAARHAERDEPR